MRKARAGAARLRRWADRIAEPIWSMSGIVLAIMLLWSGLAAHLHETRQDAVAGAHRDMQTVAKLYGEALRRSIGQIDQSLRLVRVLYGRDGFALDLADWVDTTTRAERLQVQLSLIDRDGRLRASTARLPAWQLDLSDRPPFRHFAAHPDDELFISPPLIGRLSHQWLLQFARPLRGPDGGFAGLVMLSADPDYFVRPYESVALGASVTIALVGEDGIVRASVGEGPYRLGAPASGPVAGFVAGRGTETSSTLWRDPSGRARIEAMSPVPGLPLAVAVGIARSEVMAEADYDARTGIAAAALLSLFLAVGGIALWRQRARLSHARRAMQVALDNVAQGIVLCEADGRIGLVNRRFRELLDLPSRFGPGVMATEIVAWQRAQGEFERDAPYAVAVDRMVATGEVEELAGQYRRVRPNGMVLEVRTQALPDGGAVRTYEDVSAAEHARAETERARAAAEAAMRTRAQFLAVMSHEIRTPLNGIIGVADLLAGTRLVAEQDGYVRMIRASGQHLLALASDILDFTKIDAGRLEIERIAFDPRAELSRVVTILAPGAAERGLWLRTAFAGDWPARVLGDPHRFRQVLLNIGGNAVKFTPRGGVEMRLEIAAEDDAAENGADGTGVDGTGAAGNGADRKGLRRIACTVTDTGIGIPRAVQARLFEEFTQIDSSISRRFGGTGLGLAICKRLVEAMGGGITLASEEGRGSAFRFDILVGAAPGTAQAAGEPADSQRDRQAAVGAGGTADAAAAAGRDGAAEPAMAALEVLLAEDQPINRIVAVGALERMGHRVTAVGDGEGVVAAARTGAFDLVLMDVMMPAMDGLAATRAIRALPAPPGRVPIIGVSANAFASDVETALAAGMDGFVTKPIGCERLAGEIGRVLQAACSPGDRDRARRETVPAPALPALAAIAASAGPGNAGERGGAAAEAEAGAEAEAAATLAELRALLGPESVAEVLAIFAEQLPGFLARLRRCLEAGDEAGLLREAHTIAGSAGTLGFARFAATARAFEGDLRAGAATDPAARVVALETMGEAVIAALQPAAA